MKLSLKEAKRLSIIKWEFIIKNGYPKDHEFPDELAGLSCHCDFCERSGYGIGNMNVELCNKCEFGKIAGRCPDEKSLLSRWAEKESPRLAKKILNLLKSIER
jgi:NMD protein affecting ribosome stability and mRNA decay